MAVRISSAGRPSAGLLRGECPDKIVEHVPAGPVLGKQVERGQIDEGSARLRAPGTSQVLGRWKRDVRTRVDTEQHEQMGAPATVW